MMKKVFALLVALMMVLGMGAAYAVEAETGTQQIVAGKKTGTVWYDVNGNPVAEGELGVNDVVVEMTKSVSEIAGQENVFNVTLDVRTNERLTELSTETPDAAAVLVVDMSGSMDYCAAHGEDCNYSSHTTRLELAKTAANNFIDAFGTQTNANGNDHRFMAIVAFGRHAQTKIAWADAFTETGRQRLKNVISGLTIDSDNNSIGAATNIEAGLMLADNVLADGLSKTVAQGGIGNIDLLYTVLLSDGSPTYYVENESNSPTWIQGTGGTYNNTGSNTNKPDAADVGKQAADIKERSEQSKLFTVCFGSVGNTAVLDSKPFTGIGDVSGMNPALTNGNQTTVRQWFTAFSSPNGVFNGGVDGSALSDAFQSIADIIAHGAQAWKVTDTMGPNIDYVAANPAIDCVTVAEDKNSFVWDLRAAKTDASKGMTVGTTSGVDGSTVYFYTYTYQVSLDNLNGYTAGTANDVNTSAKLDFITTKDGEWDFANLYTGTFTVPQVFGYDADLTFKKVDDIGNALEGASFKLQLKGDTTKTWQPTVSGNTFTFSNIPSGHEYILIETAKPSDDYAEAADIPLSVSYGNIVSEGFGKDNDENLTVINTLVRDDVKIIVTKNVEGIAQSDLTKLPASIQFTLTYPDGTTADFSMEKQQNNTYYKEIEVSAPGEYVVTEKADTAAVLGYTLTTIKYNGKEAQNAAVSAKVREDATVAITNTYTRDQGSVTFTKKFAENSDITAANWPADKTIAFAIKDADGNTKNVTLPVKNEDGTYSWTTTVSGLATGTATVTETITAIDGYTAAKVEDVTVNVTTKETVAAEITNTYTRNKGSLIITKDFATASAINKNNWPAGKTITFTVTDADKGTHTVTLPVLNEDAETYSWTATINSIPTGEATVAETLPKIENYTLVEPVAKKVTVTEGDTPVTVAFADNTYTQDVGYIKVTKTFAGEAAAIPASIQVNVKNAAGEVVDTLTLSGETWVATSKALPVGSYSVEEVNAEVNGYILTATAAKDVKVTKDDDPTPAEIVNKYTKNTTISKTATGLGEGATYPNPTIVLTKDSDKTEVALTANGEAAAEALVPGTYTLTENVAEVPYYTLSTTAEIDDGVNKITIKAGETFTVEAGKSYTVTVKNVYAREDSKYVDVKLDKVIALHAENEVQPEAATFIFDMTAVIDESDVSTFALDNPTIEGGKVVAELLDGSSNLALAGTDGEYTITATTNGTTGASGTIRVWVNQDDLDKLVITITEQDGGDDNWIYDTTPHQFNGEAITITNTFKKLMPRLVIEKDVQGFTDKPEDAPESLGFTITGEGVTKNVTLYAKDGWKTEIKDLEPGLYTVTENNADLPYYGVETYVDTMDNKTNSKPDIKLAYGETAAVKFINVYERTDADMLLVNIHKDILQGEVAAPDKTFTFNVRIGYPKTEVATMALVEPKTVKVMVDGKNYEGSLEEGLNFQVSIDTHGYNEDGYNKSFQVYVNAEDLEGVEMTVEELNDGTAYWTYDAENIKTVALKNWAEVKFTNEYQERSYEGLRIPFSKTVVQTGTAEPGTNTFYIEYDAWKGEGEPVAVKVHNDPLNKYGKVEVVKNAMGNDVIAITVNGANTVNGYIEVSGKDSELPDYIYMAELNGLNWELSEEELKAAGWTYDITAFPYKYEEMDGELVGWMYGWNVYFDTDENGERSVRISRNDDGDTEKAEVAFVNVYSADKELPPPPKTGDNSNIALWLALMSASALCFVIISKRRNA